MSKIENNSINRATPSWVGMYSGLITVLLCFFVFMLAQSNQELEKYKGAVSQTVVEQTSHLQDVTEEQTSNIHAVTEAQTSQLNKDDYQQIADKIMNQLNNKGVALEAGELAITSEYVLIQLPNSQLFDTGKAILRKEAVVKIDAIAEIVCDTFVDLDIQIEGHTDNVPIKSNQFPSNWELSSARAVAIANYFVNNYHVKASRVVAIGYGEYRPVTTNESVEGRVQNRRIEIKLISNKINNK